MLNKTQKTLCALAVITATMGSAMAANSVDVRVIGTITPAACTPTVSGGGVVDYGVIKASALSADAYTVLPVRQLDFSVACDARIKAGWTVTNDRPGSVAGSTEEGSGYAESPVPLTVAGFVAGLGLDGSTPIGGYAMSMSSATADGATVDTIGRSGATWLQNTASVMFTSWPGIVHTAATTGTVVPVAFSNFSAKLNVQAYINKASALDLSKQILLDGQNTIEIVYL